MAIVEGGTGYTGAAGTFSHMLKRLQPQREIERLWKQTYPILSLIKKADDFEGTQIDVPLEHDHPVVSRTFSNAQSDRYPSSGVKYSLTRTRLYGEGRVDMETARSARSDKGAWVRAIAREQQNVLLAMRKRTAVSMYRNHGGALGTISAIANGDGTDDRITLTNKADAYNFSVGMAVDAASTDGTSGSVRAGTAYVRKIDFTNGYLYMGTSALAAEDYNTTLISGSTAGDSLFAQGDFGASVRGLASWIPLTAPSSGESFLGIDRSVAPERLAGHRINDTSLSREELVQELAARISYTNGMPEVALMSPIQLKAFAMELDTKVIRDPGGKGRVGFSGIVVDTAAGPVEVLADPACPENRMYLIDPSSWTFHHLDAFPHLVQDEGLSMTRVSNADQVEFRYRCWGNLACTAPGKNGVAALPTVL